MQHYNILIGCDQNYYDTWALPLLNSIRKHNSWIRLHCHIVNPTKNNNLNGVDITSETKNFISDESRISYLQSVRFLVVADKFNKEDCVITLDADTICTRYFSEKDFALLFEKQYVLKHHKEDRWLAGFVTFSNNNFRRAYADSLRSVSIDEWKWGRDQTIMANFARQYNYQPLPKNWMSIGKNKTDSIFLTLKGEQKTKEKYLNVYRKYL